MIRNTLGSYGILSRWFHWLIFLLILIMIPLGYFMDDVENSNIRGEVFNIHKLIGLTILTLAALWALWSALNPKPALPSETRWFELWLARFWHFSLYMLLIVMPLSGWIMSVAGGKPPHYYGYAISLPIQAPNKWLGDWAFSIHNTLAIVLIVFISFHIFAAFYHHFYLKDGVLRRMASRK